jgi:hypothetical protein
MPEDSNTPAWPGRLDLLSQKFLDDELTEGEAADLLAMVTERPEAGSRLLDQLSVHELLREAARAERVEPLPARPRRVEHQGRWALWLAGAAAVAAMAALVFSVTQPPREIMVAGPQPVPVQPEPTTNAVAVLGDAFNALWEEESGSPTAGSPLDPGVLELRSGLARIDFFNGARVVLKGPAVFELVSMERAICHRGRLSAEVPPQARGFVIETPDGTVRDLGTAFGLEVGPEGAAVHVLDGEVEINDGGSSRLRAGEGARLVDGRATERFAALPGDFTLSAGAIEARRGGLARRVRDWTAAADGWNADPHLLVRFDFEGLTAPAFQLRNTAAQPAVADGTIINCPVVQGRWQGKGALQFRSLSDRVRLNVPGEFHSLSYTAWISVHSLPNRYNSLLMTEGFEYGQVHWQIVENGAMRLGFCADPSDRRRPSNYDSPPLLGPEMFGQWLHIAAVVDGGAKRVSHYLNGELVAEHQAEDLLPLRLGTACIGNWTEPYGELMIRNFSGIIDEMAVHDRALDAAEVRAMFTAGNPSSLPAGD